MPFLRNFLNLFFKARQRDSIEINISACELMETFGERAYYQARDREKGWILDGSFPAAHWRRVALEIAR